MMFRQNGTSKKNGLNLNLCAFTTLAKDKQNSFRRAQETMQCEGAFDKLSK